MIRVGFDIDGVLANFRSAFRLAAADLLRLDLDEEGDAALAPADVDRVWKKIAATHNWWTTVSAYEPRQIARLQGLAREGRWEVVFLTKRPASSGDTVQFQTQWWLEQHGFLMPSVVTVPGSRGELANALRLDLIADDQLLNCAEVVGASTTKAVLLLRAGEPENLRAHALTRGVGVVSTLAEAIDVVVRLQEMLPKRRGRFLRLAEWFPSAADAKPLDARLPRPEPSRPSDTSSSPSAPRYSARNESTEI